MGAILRCKLALTSVKIDIWQWQFVPNLLSYVFAKYYLNWFTVRKVITKYKG